MFKDSKGFDCFIDSEGKLHHAMGTGDIFLSYENIMKNFNRLDPFKGFMIKQYNKLGVFTGEYKYTVNVNIMLNTPEFVELAKIYHPQLLV